MSQFNPLPLVKAAGSHAQMGKTAGLASRNRTQHSLETYRKTFSLCDIKWDDAIAKAGSHLEVIKEFTPHLLEELQGLADGTGVAMDSLLALNCRTEILPPDFLLRAMASASAGGSKVDVHGNECTSLAVARENSPVWLAQNWDWVSTQRDALIVLHAQPEASPEYITVTEAGMLAKIGINNRGFAVSLNILRSNNDGQTPGMPVHFLLRALLESGSVEEACKFAAQLPYASSSNIMIADSNGNIASLELSPEGCRVVEPDNNQLCHTNHFLNPELAAGDAGLEGNISTVKRLTKAREHLTDINNFDDIKNLLSDTSDGINSICRFADENLPEIAQIETIVAVAMNLTEQSLFVSAAQPSITEFTEYRCNEGT